MVASKVQIYRSVLTRFMFFKDGAQYTNATQFTQQDLIAITPYDIYRWFKMKAYGNPNINEDELNPVHNFF